MAEPARKKQKTDIDTIFLQFKKNKEILRKLEYALHAVQYGYSRMNLCLLKLAETDARTSQTFSRAFCKTSKYKVKTGGWDNLVPLIYSIGSIFEDGLETLRNYLKEETEIPQDEASRRALGKLLAFLGSSLNSLDPSNTEQKNCKCNWSVQLAHHLFSKLAVECSYTLEDKYYSADQLNNGEEYACTCGKNNELKGDFGDTSFGCPDAWHGTVDILLENVPVRIASDNEDSSDSNARGTCSTDSSDCGNESSAEMETGKDFRPHLSEMIAQSIVFSFLQRKQNGDSLENFLVPSVGVNTSSVVVLFYDSKNDILFQSTDLPLFYVGKSLDVKTVVFLWLTLNYRCFCSGITEDMKGYKANFFDRVGDYLSKYEKEVVRPVDRISQIHVDKLEDNWANECGIYTGSQNKVRLKYLKLQ